MRVKNKINIFIKKYNGNPITVKEMSEISGIPMIYIYKNKKYIESLGILFQHANKNKTLEDKAFLKHTSKTLEKALPNLRLFKSCLRLAYQKIGLPSPVYVDKNIYNSTIDQECSFKSISLYLKKCLYKDNLIPKDLLVDTIKIINEIEFRSIYRISNDDTSAIIKEFKNKYGANFEPTDEQIKAVAYMSKAFLFEDGFKYIQAKAGTSKTTCISALYLYMVNNYNKVVQCISLTNKAVKELPNGSKTFHKLIKDMLDLSDVINMDDESLRYIAEMKESSNEINKIDYLIVDEYTLLTPSAVEVCKRIAKNIVFVGDKAQLENGLVYIGNFLCTLSEQFRFKNAEDSLQIDVTEARFSNDIGGMNNIIKPKFIGFFSGKLKYKDEGTKKIGYIDYNNAFTVLKKEIDEYKDLNSIILAYSSNACKNINKIANNGEDIKIGSKVILKRPVYNKRKVVQSSFGIVTSIRDDSATVDFDGKSVKVDMDSLELGYAITTLSAQGSSWDYVLFADGTSPKSFRIADIYVGVTRAKIGCKVIKKIDCDNMTHDDKLMYANICYDLITKSAIQALSINKEIP